jgi:hypothetical protein
MMAPITAGLTSKTQVNSSLGLMPDQTRTTVKIENQRYLMENSSCAENGDICETK